MFCRFFVLSLIRKGVDHVPKKRWRWSVALDQCSSEARRGEARKHGDVEAVLLWSVFFMPLRGTCPHKVAEHIKYLEIIL